MAEEEYNYDISDLLTNIPNFYITNQPQNNLKIDEEEDAEQPQTRYDTVSANVNSDIDLNNINIAKTVCKKVSRI